jgi:hypothetical protein
MKQSVQLSIADGQFATAVRAGLSRTCAWQVEAVECPDLSRHSVLVLDQQAFARLPLPLSNPELIVLIAHKELQGPQLAQAWEAGIVSVVSEEDPLNTVLLAIMAAALRLEKSPASTNSSEITPSTNSKPAPLAPLKRPDRQIRGKAQ